MKKEDDTDYVMLPPDITTILYSDTLHLTQESTGKEISIQKPLIRVGRHSECDLRIDSSKNYVARLHASFIYERSIWFLRDDNSTNGTWLNGQKIKPGVKYQLNADDKIDLAHSEIFIFEKIKKHNEENFKGNEEEKAMIYLQVGMSRVFLGLDKSLNKTLTIKAYDKTQHSFNTVVYDSVMQETHMMMKLEHPCIPHVIDLIENENYLFIIREYVEGRTLDSIVGENGSMPVETVLDIAKRLCGTLHYLHTLTPPHIHRDIKPANIILTPDGAVRLIDFGIMRLYDPKKTMDTVWLGTKGYAAPEQYGGIGQTDARTDIYGLGMTMFNLITGINPNDPPYEIKPIRQINPALPKRLEEIICKCIEPNPDKRYQSAAALMAVLNGEKDPDAPKGLFGKFFEKNKLLYDTTIVHSIVLDSSVW